MKKATGVFLACFALALAAIPLVAQDGGSKKPTRIEVSELVVRDAESGNSVTIMARRDGAAIFVTNNRTKRTVTLSAFGRDQEDVSQTFVGIFTEKQSRTGHGHNWAVSLDADGKPVQQVANSHEVRTREIKLK